MISSLALYKESRFPASKKRKAAALDGIDYKEESRFPASKKRKAAALDSIDYKEESRFPASKKRKAAAFDGIEIKALHWFRWALLDYLSNLMI